MEIKLNKYGYVRKQVMLHLMEHGQLTAFDLALKIKAPYSSINNACYSLRARGLIQAGKNKGCAENNTRMRTLFGLTKKGIERALAEELEGNKK